MKKYAFALFMLTGMSLLLVGLSFLFHLANQSSSSVSIISNIGTAFGLIALEWGRKPTEFGKKNDLILVAFLSIITIIASIIISLFLEQIELWRLILIPILGFAAYWFGKRFLPKDKVKK